MPKLSDLHVGQRIAVSTGVISRSTRWCEIIKKVSRVSGCEDIIHYLDDDGSKKWAYLSQVVIVNDHLHPLQNAG